MKLRELENELLRKNARIRAGYDNVTAPTKMGELLRKLRESNRLTQRDLSVVSGVQQSEISRHEAGQAPRGLTISQLETIAHAQGVEVIIGFAQRGIKGNKEAPMVEGRSMLLYTVL
jgi:transcriptional regulator with XRE-family HTH domain